MNLAFGRTENGKPNQLGSEPGVVSGDFAEREVLYQIGVPPSRIDIMTSVTGLDFETAWPNRVMATFGDVEAPVLGLDDMRTAKRAAARLKDLQELCLSFFFFS